jgi:LPXTG-motif cell wall-anchored protein
MIRLKRNEGNAGITAQAGIKNPKPGKKPRHSNPLIRIPLFVGTILAIFALVGMVSGYSTPDSITAAGKVYVSNVSYDPGSMYDGDKGTVSIAVTNGNTDTGIVVNHAQLTDATIQTVSRPYDSSSNIGPGQTQDYVFSVVADGVEGTYFPTFSLSFRDADSLYYRTMVKIDNKLLDLTISDKPDTFSAGRKDTIYTKISNSRDNDVKNVILEISGPGAKLSPSKIFVGAIKSGAIIPVNFSVTPDQPTTLHLKVTYDNGDNTHTTSYDLPIDFDENKMQADPIMSNIQLTKEGSLYHVSGDVTNAGLETANAVTVTSLDPAIPQDPYKSSIVGVLKPDDFGSFEVTFSAEGTTSVPLQMTYKDADGNVITSRQNVNIASVVSTDQTTSQPLLLPVIGLIVVIALVGGYLYLKKRKNQ